MEFKPPGPLLAEDIDTELIALAKVYLDSATQHPFDMSVWRESASDKRRLNKLQNVDAGVLTAGLWLSIDKYGALAGPRDLSELNASEVIRNIALTHRALTFRDACKQTLGRLKKDFEKIEKARTNISSVMRSIPPDAYRVMLIPYDESDYEHEDTKEAQRLIGNYHKYLEELGEKHLINSGLPNFPDPTVFQQYADDFDTLAFFLQAIALALKGKDTGGSSSLLRMFQMDPNRRLVHDCYQAFIAQGKRPATTEVGAFDNFVQTVRLAATGNGASLRKVIRNYRKDRMEYEIAFRQLIPVFEAANYRGEAEFIKAHDVLLSHQNNYLPERSIIKTRTRVKRPDEIARLEAMIERQWDKYLIAKSALDRGIPLK